MFDPTAAVEAAIANKNDEQRQKEARYQEERRASLRTPSDIDLKMQFGRRLENMAMRAIEKHPEKESEYSRLAEAYALQGQYELAAQVTKNPHKKAEYDAVLAALDGMPDCQCPTSSRVGSQTVQHRFHKARIFARGKIVNLYACALCGRLRCSDN